MFIPVIGLLSAIAAALGLYGLVWYENLTKEEKEKADRLACEYAKTLYSKGLHQLTSSQLDIVQGLVKTHLGK